MISLVIPAYNEEDVIEKCIEHVESKVNLKDTFELIVVNDGSTDSTREIVKRLRDKYSNLRLINHKKNIGIGGALRTCFKYAEGDIIVTMDSDLTHSIEHIEKMVEEVEKNCDVCVASRYVAGGGMKNVPKWRVVVSVYANKIFSLIFGTKVRDVTSGFKAYKAEKIKRIELKHTGFDVQLEIMVKLIKMRCKFREIPSVLVNREFGMSKFNFFEIIPFYAVNILILLLYRWFVGVRK